MRNFVTLFCLYFLVSCSVTSQEINSISKEEKTIWESFKLVPSSANLQMTNDKEPGEKLILCITFIDKLKKTPLENQKVLLYQTSNDGNYNPEIAGNEKTARIRGEGYTDGKGRMYVNTILPGSYATSGDNRHIHTQVFGAKPQAYDMHFAQYTNARMKRFIEERDQFFLVDLKYTVDKKLIGFVTIEVKKSKKTTKHD